MSASTDPETRRYSFFIGNIPPFLRFEMAFHSLFHLVESHKSDQLFEDINPATEVATIGLIAQFEAFCKHQFAGLVNIHSDLLGDFSKKRMQTAIRLDTLVSVLGRLDESLGFLVVEQYDFGSPDEVNGLFRDLVGVSPFSKEEAAFYDGIRSERNLLVHHAGIYTLKHIKNYSLPKSVEAKALQDSVKISTERYHEMGDFLFNMAMKIVRVTISGLRDRLAETQHALEGERLGAMNLLLQGLYDELE